MFSVEKMKQEDLPFAVELANTMDWNMTDADFVFNMKMEPEGCFVLKENSRTVGLATCISYGKVGWFGNLIVEEAQRKHGAGTMLVEHAASYLQSLGVTTVGLYAYKHLVNFYRNAGFECDAEFLILKAEEIVKPTSLENHLKIEAPTQEDISEMVKLDSECFGSSRAKLLRTILADKGNICCVVKEEGEVEGFAASKVFDGMAEIGPLVCHKAHLKTARALLSAVQSRLEGSEAYICLPSNNAELLEESGRFGFKEEFKVVRMFLGSPVQKDCIYLAESLERG
jgi:GNAT superfamily N-acetyltransferase